MVKLKYFQVMVMLIKIICVARNSLSKVFFFCLNILDIILCKLFLEQDKVGPFGFDVWNQNVIKEMLHTWVFLVWMRFWKLNVFKWNKHSLLYSLIWLTIYLVIKALVLCELVNKYLNKNWQNVTENDVKTFKKFEVTIKHIKIEIEILTDSGTDHYTEKCLQPWVGQAQI